MRNSKKGQSMSYARLILRYTKIDDPNVEYLLRAIVDPTESKPDLIKNCLVVAAGSSSAQERLVRVATYADLITTPFEVLPETVNVFSSPSLDSLEGGSILVGDEIYATSPFLWKQFSGVSDVFECEVITVIDPTTAIVTPPFPFFGSQLKFCVKRGGHFMLGTNPYASTCPIDGLANRDYTGLTGPNYLTAYHADSWSNLTDAENAYASFRAQAQSLVDALNADHYQGEFQEVYN